MSRGLARNEPADASMEPRSVERGKLRESADAFAETLYASMEPRSVERGKSDTSIGNQGGYIGFNGAALG